MTINQKYVVLDGVSLSMFTMQVVFQHVDKTRSFIYLLQLKIFNILNQNCVNQRGIKG